MWRFAGPQLLLKSTTLNHPLFQTPKYLGFCSICFQNLRHDPIDQRTSPSSLSLRRNQTTSTKISNETNVVRRNDLFIPAVMDDPSESSTISYSLLVRGGYIRQLTHGIHSFLPLGHRVLRNVCNIIEEELVRVGGLQVQLPLLHPRTLWEKSGRWEAVAGELFKLKDRKGVESCLAPTHEEVITSLVASTVSSYKELPIRLFQIGTKFRDEIRPRHGLSRGREFTMLDLYSFDDSVESALQSYRLVCDAFRTIFRRIELDVVVAEAQSGNISDNPSQEFHVLCPSMGEDFVLHCPSCLYTANIERGQSKVLWEGYHFGAQEESFQNTKSFIDFVVGLGMEIFLLNQSECEDQPSSKLLILPPDRGVNQEKLKKVVKNSDGIESVTRVLSGNELHEDSSSFSCLFDNSLCTSSSTFNPIFVSGDPLSWEKGDLVNGKDGDLCVQNDCGSPLLIKKGIEVGHVFHLGVKYSEILKAVVKEKDGSLSPIEMGCYGIGVSRLLAAIVEMNHDNKGIKWPFEVAPYKAVVIPVGRPTETSIYNTALSLSSQLQNLHGFQQSVVLDDRRETPGIRFAEAELIGYPFVIVVGKSYTQDGLVEVWIRSTGEKKKMQLEDVIPFFSATRNHTL